MAIGNTALILFLRKITWNTKISKNFEIFKKTRQHEGPVGAIRGRGIRWLTLFGKQFLN